jgi:hypothetical protein
VSLTSTRKRGGYYHVTLQDGREGWVLAKNISVGQPTPAVTPTPQPQAGGKAFDPGCTLPFDAIKQKHPIIDDTCSIDGNKKGGGKLTEGKLAENHAKNNFCLTGTPVDISYDDLLQLQSARGSIHDTDLTSAADRTAKLTKVITVNGQSIGEGTLVRITLHVMSTEYADTKDKYPTTYGESCNCYRPSNEENDIHIALGKQTSGDECVSVTAEMNPHFRPAKWTPDNVKLVGGRPVRVTGQLFYDSSHVICQPGKPAKPPRASLWEIHPVYRFEVCTLNDTASCQNAPDSAWTPLDQFHP